jgi:LysR family transcriptional regulator, nitrogen assimilation regulatory protein
MDLKQLEYFVRVADVGSFSRAAIALDVAQPALSKQVRMLEVELRRTLFVRNGRGVSPTDAGKLLLEHGRGILHQVQRAREELGRVDGALAGRVAIGLPPSIARVLAAPLIREFRSHMPEAALSISEGTSYGLREDLIQGRLDLALLYNPPPSTEIDLVHLLEEEMFLVQCKSAKGAGKGTSAAPITLKEVAHLPLVIPTRPHTLRLLLETEMARQGCRPLVALEVDSVAAILDIVADGAGTTVLSRRSTQTLAATAFELRPIVSPPLRSKLSLAVSAQRPATLTQKAVQELIPTVVQSFLLGGRAKRPR